MLNCSKTLLTLKKTQVTLSSEMPGILACCTMSLLRITHRIKYFYPQFHLLLHCPTMMYQSNMGNYTNDMICGNWFVCEMFTAILINFTGGPSPPFSEPKKITKNRIFLHVFSRMINFLIGVTYDMHITI